MTVLLRDCPHGDPIGGSSIRKGGLNIRRPIECKQCTFVTS